MCWSVAYTTAPLKERAQQLGQEVALLPPAPPILTQLCGHLCLALRLAVCPTLSSGPHSRDWPGLEEWAQIPALGRQKWEDQEFKAILGYIARPYLKKKKNLNKKRKM